MEDKTLVCQDCGAEFVFTVGERNFTKKKASITNLKDVKNADLKENSLPEDQEMNSRTVPNGI